MKCSKCNIDIPENSRHCPACEADNGFPNVRAAAEPKNIEALKKRVDDAKLSARARKCHELLENFNTAMFSSNAMLCRPLSVVCRLMKSDNELIQTYYQEIESKGRLPENNEWDSSRESVDSKIFPNYHKEIHCAFLVLEMGEEIIENYGDCGLVFKEKAIEERASVFEENPIIFCEKHGIVGRKEVPNGYRATWQERNFLAVAKLHPKIDNTKTEDNFPKILLCKTPDNASTDFIEVHIYGRIHRASVKKVITKEPAKRPDRVMLDSLKTLLKKAGILLEVTK